VDVVALRLTRLATERFRNLQGGSVSLDAPVIVLHGANGEGKTNTLEAVHYLATLKPLRGRRSRELLRFGERDATVTADVTCGVSRELSVTLRADGRDVSLDGKRIGALAEWFASVRAISFTPADAEIVGGEPARRRNWLDRAAFTVSPAHLDRVWTVRRLLDQKQAALRGDRPDRGVLDVLDEQLATHGAELVERRASMLSALLPHVREVHAGLADGRGEVDLELVTQARGDDRASRADALRTRLAAWRDRELERRTTLAGPQLDEVRITLDGRPARDFGSRGQIRSIVLALKLGETHAARDRGLLPLFLLDDLSSELDAGRTGRLVRALSSMGAQVLATTTDPAPLLAALPPGEALPVRVSAGSLAVG
jgi:DNA replication and repair protein RecF